MKGNASKVTAYNNEQIDGDRKTTATSYIGEAKQKYCGMCENQSEETR